MPLLLCPNDNSPMQTVNRSAVEFDMCPECRGVWLDRGELEKMMALGREDGERSAQPDIVQQPYPAPQAPPQQGGWQPRYHADYGERGERGEYGERGEHGHYGTDGRRRKRGFDLVDIFD